VRLLAHVLLQHLAALEHLRIKCVVVTQGSEKIRKNLTFFPQNN
jgi:hypothetical protein